MNRYWNLVWEMTWCEFRLRDQGSALGFLWTLLYPALLFGVLYGLCRNWIGVEVENFPAHLLVGIVFWNFFAHSTAYAQTAILRKEHLVANANFSKSALVLAAVLSVGFSHLLETLLLLAVLPLLGTPPTWGWTFVLDLVATAWILSLGVSMLLAALTPFFRDLERIWSLLLFSGFFLTPIFYTVEQIPAGVAFWIRLNPMTHLLSVARGLLLPNAIPWITWGAVLAFSGVLCLVSLIIFRAAEPKFAEVVG